MTCALKAFVRNNSILRAFPTLELPYADLERFKRWATGLFGPISFEDPAVRSETIIAYIDTGTMIKFANPNTMTFSRTVKVTDREQNYCAIS